MEDGRIRKLYMLQAVEFGGQVIPQDPFVAQTSLLSVPDDRCGTDKGFGV